MTDTQDNRAAHSEGVRNWIAIGAFAVFVMLTYAFAAGGWNLAGVPAIESSLATDWQRFNTPAETDIAKKR
jgi:hypothetical protein